MPVGGDSRRPVTLAAIHCCGAARGNGRAGELSRSPSTTAPCRWNRGASLGASSGDRAMRLRLRQGRRGTRRPAKRYLKAFPPSAERDRPVGGLPGLRAAPATADGGRCPPTPPRRRGDVGRQRVKKLGRDRAPRNSYYVTGRAGDWSDTEVRAPPRGGRAARGRHLSGELPISPSQRVGAPARAAWRKWPKIRGAACQPREAFETTGQLGGFRDGGAREALPWKPSIRGRNEARRRVDGRGATGAGDGSSLH